MEKTPFEKLESLKGELERLRIIHKDKYLYDPKTSLFHKYVVGHVCEWMNTTYPNQDKEHSNEEIHQLIGEILNYIAHKINRRENSNYYKDLRGAFVNKKYTINDKTPNEGAKYYAHSYRDNGQFGSFPTHDDYTEEGDL